MITAIALKTPFHFLTCSDSVVVNSQIVKKNSLCGSLHSFKHESACYLGIHTGSTVFPTNDKHPVDESLQPSYMCEGDCLSVLALTDG